MTDPTSDRHTWRIQSEPARVPPLIREILEAMDDLSLLSIDNRADVKLLLNELLYNAVIHGNHSDARKVVSVKLIVGDGFICVTIVDEGAGFNMDGAVALSRRPDMLLNESGRGMRLAMALADEIIYSLNGRQVTFIKRLGAAHG